MKKFINSPKTKSFIRKIKEQEAQSQKCDLDDIQVVIIQ
jgi:hypothetical protein